MFRLLMAGIMTISSIISVMVLAQPCTDDSHCTVGFVCDMAAHACSECLRCDEIKRQSLTPGSTCVSSVVDCGSCLDGYTDDPTTFPHCVRQTIEDAKSIIWPIVAGVCIIILVCGITFLSCRCLYKKRIRLFLQRVRPSPSAKFTPAPLNESPPPTPSAPLAPSTFPFQLSSRTPVEGSLSTPLQTPVNPPIQSPPAYGDVYPDSREVPLRSREMSSHQNAVCSQGPYYDNEPSENVPSMPQEDEESALLNSYQEQNGNDHVDNSLHESAATAVEPEPTERPGARASPAPHEIPLGSQGLDNTNNSCVNSSSNYDSSSYGNNRNNNSINNNNGGNNINSGGDNNNSSNNGGPTMTQSQCQFIVIKMPISIGINSDEQPHSRRSDVTEFIMP